MAAVFVINMRIAMLALDGGLGVSDVNIRVAFCNIYLAQGGDEDYMIYFTLHLRVRDYTT